MLAVGKLAYLHARTDGEIFCMVNLGKKVLVDKTLANSSAVNSPTLLQGYIAPRARARARTHTRMYMLSHAIVITNTHH